MKEKYNIKIRRKKSLPCSCTVEKPSIKVVHDNTIAPPTLQAILEHPTIMKELKRRHPPPLSRGDKQINQLQYLMRQQKIMKERAPKLKSVLKRLKAAEFNPSEVEKIRTEYHKILPYKKKRVVKPITRK